MQKEPKHDSGKPLMGGLGDPESPLARPSPEIDMAELRRSSIRGGSMTLASQAINIAIQLASTVVLARLLSPEDYGLMAMVLAVTGFAGLFRDLGLSSAAIQKKDLTPAQQSNLFWLNVATGAALTALVAAASPLVAWFYGKPELTTVTLTLSSTFLIGSFGAQHGASLVREMQFTRQAIATISGAIIGMVIAIALALRGFSYWSLVWGNLGGAIVTTVLLLALSPFWPGLPARGAGVREMLRFGANITAFELVNYFQRNLDNILIGKLSGSLQLGLYSRAYSLLMLPITSIRGPINAVAFPAMSRLQSEPAAFRHYYLKTTSLVAFLSMPLAGFFFVASKPVIELVLGPQWLGVSPIFSYLALAAFIQPSAGLAGSMLLSLGHGERYLKCGLFNALIIISGFAIGVNWGALGVAKSYAVTNIIVVYPWLRWAYKGTSVRVVDFLDHCSLPAMISIVSGIIGITLRNHISAYPPIVQCSIFISVFAVITAVGMAATERGNQVSRMLIGLVPGKRPG